MNTYKYLLPAIGIDQEDDGDASLHTIIEYIHCKPLIPL